MSSQRIMRVLRELGQEASANTRVMRRFGDNFVDALEADLGRNLNVSNRADARLLGRRIVETVADGMDAGNPNLSTKAERAMAIREMAQAAGVDMSGREGFARANRMADNAENIFQSRAAARVDAGRPPLRVSAENANAYTPRPPVERVISPQELRMQRIGQTTDRLTDELDEALSSGNLPDNLDAVTGRLLDHVRAQGRFSQSAPSGQTASQTLAAIKRGDDVHPDDMANLPTAMRQELGIETPNARATAEPQPVTVTPVEQIATAADRILGEIDGPGRTFGQQTKAAFTSQIDSINRALPQAGWSRTNSPSGRTPREALEAMSEGQPVHPGDIQRLSNALDTIASGIDTQPSGGLGSVIGGITNAVTKGKFGSPFGGNAQGGQAFSSTQINRLLDGESLDNITARPFWQQKRYMIPAATAGFIMAPNALEPLANDGNPEVTSTAESIVDAWRMPGYFAAETLDTSSFSPFVDWEIAGYKVDPLTENVDMRRLLDPRQDGVALDSNQRAALATQLGLQESATLPDIQEAAARRLVQTTAGGFLDGEQSYRQELFSRYDNGSTSELGLREFEITALTDYITPRIPGPAQNLPEAGRIEFVRMYGYSDASPEERNAAATYRQQVIDNGANPLQRQVLAVVDEVIANETQRSAEVETQEREETMADFRNNTDIEQVRVGGRNGSGSGSTRPEPTQSGYSISRFENNLFGHGLEIEQVDEAKLEFSRVAQGNGNNVIDTPEEKTQLENTIRQRYNINNFSINL